MADKRKKRKGTIRSTKAWFGERIPAKCIDLLDEIMITSGESRSDVLTRLIETEAEMMTDREPQIEKILSRPEKYYIDRKRLGKPPFPSVKAKVSR